MAQSTEYSTVLDKFTGKFYQESASQPDNKDKNIILSGLSANVVLSMVALGAQDETKNELCCALCIDDMDKVTPSIKALIEELNDTKGVTLKLANKVYVKEALSGGENLISSTYRSSVEDIFKSEIQQLNFAKNVEAAASINGWVEDRTNKRIKDLIKASSLSADTAAVLVNAIYFKGDWAKPFDPKDTQKEDFHLTNGSTAKVDMMNMKSKFFYKVIPDLDAKAIVLPYENNDLSMVIILPNQKDGINNLEKDLANGVKEHIENMRYEEVILKLPKFKIETTINVKDVLIKLGAKRLFSFEAQLRGILKNNVDLYVSEAIQKAFIEVNEEGSEAAAATGIIMSECCRFPPDPIRHFTADRPFFYQIMYKTQPLFSGSLKK